MLEKPFTLDRVTDLPRYVFKDSYQTVLDDKSGYDHLLLSEEGHTYFGIQWGGWYFTYNSLPFGGMKMCLGLEEICKRKSALFEALSATWK